MTLNSYEIVYILRPDAPESVNIDLVNYYRNLIKNGGGRSVVVQYHGRRHLSYNISHYYDGIYVQVSYDGNGQLTSALEKSMSLNDNILRYLTIKSSAQI